ncbi:MAG: aminopeptidase [Candidatus Cloacimonetes bacterium]|jgi:hypothetical protein|nr:aminopeptidase [Candidatus Cloacimonadota bacterium]
MKTKQTLIQKKNEQSQKDYEELFVKIKKINTETANQSGDKWKVFFYELSLIMLNAVKVEKDISEEYFKIHSIEHLKELNVKLNKEVLFDNYKQSYLNPKYSVQVFGEKFGQLNSVISAIVYSVNAFACEHIIYKMAYVFSFFNDYYKTWQENNENYEVLLKVLNDYQLSHLYESSSDSYYKRFSSENDFYTRWIKDVDLSDLRYLFYYGSYISDNDIKIAKFLNSLTQEKIDRVMHQTAKAYILGFKEGDKDFTKKKTVALYFRVGMERLAKSLVNEIESKYGLKVLISVIIPGKYNQQYNYDHRFDSALFLDDEFKKNLLVETEKAIEDNKEIIQECSGNIYFDPFGDKPFAPENKKECLKLNDQQMKLNQEIRANMSMMINKYYKRSEISFCIIGFPTPEIGEKFEEIFDKTIDINMLDHEHWLKIQQYLIDALDQADRVLVKGTNGNRTNLTVKLPTLDNPEKQTNFNNCGATVNIPVGEVFNTPQLTGTNGNLHISETFLNSLYYKDLDIKFEDGRIAEYNCKNYDNDEDNKKYIEENLIFPHKSLPLGEFAIGTNTLAYAVAKKYKILNVLPILIIEKMGPHFAIGDTCYSWEEDTPVFNPDGKEIISRDNEHTLIRKEDPSKAYTNCHVDITLPYEEIGVIQAVKPNGDTIDIIKNGRFVLKGTEELNTYLDDIK